MTQPNMSDSTLTGFSYLARCFDSYADRPFVSIPGADPLSDATLTYRAFWQLAERYWRRLHELGMRPNDRLLLRLENSEDVLALYLACGMGGFIACPFDVEEPEARLAGAMARLAPRYVCNASTRGEWSAAPSAATPPSPPSEPDRPLFMITSSGITGRPKDIVLGADSIVESARSFSALAEYGNDTVVYHHFPMFYMAGIFNHFLSPAVSGSRLVLGPRFSAAGMARFWELPRRTAVNHLTLTPTMAFSLARLYRPDDDVLGHLASYEKIISTGSILYDTVAEQFQAAFGAPLRSCYGVTEVGGSITLQSWDQAVARESVGHFRPEVCIQAGDAAAPGEILVRTPFGMKGYWVDGELRTAVDERGFFHTGDQGYLRSGLLYVTGRSHDLVKKGGEFVALPPIEDLALRNPGVVEAAAVAVPDTFWGHKVVLFYVPRAAIEIDALEHDLMGAFGEQLRTIEIPDKLIPVPTIPRSAVGKPLKSALVKRYTV